MHLIVALGNPGSAYHNTRHNAGYMILDYLASQNNWLFSSKHNAVFYKGALASKSIIAIKPKSYMNTLGPIVLDVASFYKIPSAHVVVLQDDITMALGAVRAKKGGGHGGHNGIKSIMAHLSSDFIRLKLGVGYPVEGQSALNSYVLSLLPMQEQDVLNQSIKRISKHFERLLCDDLNGFNSLVNQAQS